MRFFSALRRRGVLKIATGYLIVWWLVLEVGHTLFNVFELPHAILKLVFVLLAIGFPIVLFAVWHGWIGTSATHGDEAKEHSGPSHEGPWLAAVFGLVAVLAVTVALGIRFFGLSPAAHTSAHGNAEQVELEGKKVAPPAMTVAPSDKSIAVMPFLNLSEDKNNEYFSDGLSEELIDLLTKIPGLHVPARTSSFYFKGRQVTINEIARTLAVAHVLEGSVRKSGNTVRITAQLIRADNGFHVWSETFDRNLDDVFKIQDEIAGAVVDKLKVALLNGAPEASPRPVIVEAHNLLLQGRYLTDHDIPEDLNKAVELYDRAIALDPGYASAYAGLARAQVRRVAQGLDTTGAGYAKATSAARRAIELDPRLSEPYLMLATATLQYTHEWPKAVELLRKARELDPNNPELMQTSAHLEHVIGTLSKAEDYFHRGIAIDPLNLTMRRYLGKNLFYQGRLDEAELELRRVIELNPLFPAAHYELCRVLIARGDPIAALAAAQAEPSPAWKRFSMPLAYWALNRRADAQAAFATLIGNSAGSEYQVAETYATMGQTVAAFHWLAKARDQHDPGLIHIRYDPALSILIADTRYAEILRSLNMSP